MRAQWQVRIRGSGVGSGGVIVGGGGICDGVLDWRFCFSGGY